MQQIEKSEIMGNTKIGEERGLFCLKDFVNLGLAD